MAGDAIANGIGRSRNQGKLDSYVAILFVFGGFFVLAKLIAKQINSLNFQWLTRATRIHNPLIFRFDYASSDCSDSGVVGLEIPKGNLLLS